MPTLAQSSLKGAAPGDVTFIFGVREAQPAETTITIVASEAIFTQNTNSSSTAIQAFTEGTQAADRKSTSTAATDSGGKSLTVVVKSDLTANRVFKLTITTLMAVNPSAAGAVTISIKSSVSTVAVSSIYPIFDAPDTALFLRASVGTDERGAAPGSMSFTLIPQASLAAGEKYTITSSAAVFAASQSLACAIAPTPMAGVDEDCTSASDATGKVLTVTLANEAAIARYPVTIMISSHLGTNSANAGPGPTFSLKASAGDTTESTDNPRYYIFGATYTPYWISAALSNYTALAIPSVFKVKFVPQNTIKGGLPSGEVIITASHPIFTPSQTPSVTCSTTAYLYPKAVKCNAVSHLSGRILTVATNTVGEDFLRSAVATIAITSHLAVNTNHTKVTFEIKSNYDPTALTAQRGFTTSILPPEPAAKPPAVVATAVRTAEELQTALDYATPGDTIVIVQDFTASSCIVITKGVTLTSDAPNNTHTSLGVATMATQGHLAAGVAIKLVEHHQSVTISKIKVSGSCSSTRHAHSTTTPLMYQRSQSDTMHPHGLAARPAILVHMERDHDGQDVAVKRLVLQEVVSVLSAGHAWLCAGRSGIINLEISKCHVTGSQHWLLDTSAAPTSQQWMLDDLEEPSGPCLESVSVTHSELVGFQASFRGCVGKPMRAITFSHNVVTSTQEAVYGRQWSLLDMSNFKEAFVEQNRFKSTELPTLNMYALHLWSKAALRPHATIRGNSLSGFGVALWATCVQRSASVFTDFASLTFTENNISDVGVGVMKNPHISQKVAFYESRNALGKLLMSDGSCGPNFVEQNSYICGKQFCTSNMLEDDSYSSHF